MTYFLRERCKLHETNVLSVTQKQTFEFHVSKMLAKTLEINLLAPTATQSPFCLGLISPQGYLYSAVLGFLTLIPSDPDGALIDVDCNVSVDPFSYKTSQYPSL